MIWHKDFKEVETKKYPLKHQDSETPCAKWGGVE